MGSYWEVSADAGFISTTYLSGLTTDYLTTLDLNAVGVVLPIGPQYVRVRYEGDTGILSEWSATVTFDVSQAMPTTQRATVTSSDLATGDLFGSATGMSDDGLTCVIGTPGEAPSGVALAGSVYFYSNTASGWVETTKVSPPSPITSGYFGTSVAMSADGSTAIVGEPGANTGLVESGGAYLYRKDSGGVWSLISNFVPPTPKVGGRFGTSVAISDNLTTVVIGSTNPTLVGEVSVFTLDVSGVWVLRGSLTSADGFSATSFGKAVAINSTASLIVVGAHLDDAVSTDSGSVYVYALQVAGWVEIQKISSNNPAAGGIYGSSLSLSDTGDVLAIGAPGEVHTLTGAGACHVYARSSTTGDFVFSTRLLGNDVSLETFGKSVSVCDDGSTIAVGAPGNDTTLNNSGSVHLFNKDAGGTWPPSGTVTSSTTTALAALGSSVSLSSRADVLLSGAPSNESLFVGGGTAIIFS